MSGTSNQVINGFSNYVTPHKEFHGVIFIDVSTTLTPEQVVNTTIITNPGEVITFSLPSNAQFEEYLGSSLSEGYTFKFNIGSVGDNYYVHSENNENGNNDIVYTSSNSFLGYFSINNNRNVEFYRSTN